jgi:hypothetical protein
MVDRLEEVARFRDGAVVASPGSAAPSHAAVASPGSAAPSHAVVASVVASESMIRASRAAGAESDGPSAPAIATGDRDRAVSTLTPGAPEPVERCRAAAATHGAPMPAAGLHESSTDSHPPGRPGPADPLTAPAVSPTDPLAALAASAATPATHAAPARPGLLRRILRRS